MRISKTSLDNCEPLFNVFIREANELDLFRSQLFDIEKLNQSLFSETLRILTLYHSDRVRAAYCLLVNGLVWDAEVIIRVFYETVAKVLFLACAKGATRDRLLSEFWEILPAIYDRKGSEKAISAEKLTKQMGATDDSRVFAYLRNSKFFSTRPVENRKFRKSVEQRWAFAKIVETLNTTNQNYDRVPSIDVLMHGYGTASHLAHASPKAIDLMEDRATRGDDLPLLEVGHVCRMLSDLISLSCFSLYFSNRALNNTTTMPEVLQTSFNRMSVVLEPHQTDFARSQDEFYTKWSAEA